MGDPPAPPSREGEGTVKTAGDGHGPRRDEREFVESSAHVSLTRRAGGALLHREVRKMTMRQMFRRGGKEKEFERELEVAQMEEGVRSQDGEVTKERRAEEDERKGKHGGSS